MSARAARWNTLCAPAQALATRQLPSQVILVASKAAQPTEESSKTAGFSIVANRPHARRYFCGANKVVPEMKHSQLRHGRIGRSPTQPCAAELTGAVSRDG